ncbi:hypothetical protein [Vibrio mediterranei]|uniref:DUF4402 domain-containing protein n=1 Tax=Vibrio mediterranei TaxID=689 RepID=A0ABX5D586_9VIBR|nr:hypothetical protein [Vibrio mediterranei]PCD86432.1 hypothetical protein COR52_21355 [Vibrio mediterranei]PRQ64759.1 hypothetical protein COR51_25920 [Vibrio mediterranei]SBO11584.1 hypothetical protein VME0621_03720 [Vibrio mediterranei]
MRTSTALLVAGMLVITNHAVYANNNFSLMDNDAEIEFKASIEAQCGLEVLKDKGDLAFGDSYLADAAQIQIIDNRQNGRVLLRLDDLEYEQDDYLKNLEYSFFHFKVTGSGEKEGSALAWMVGKTFTRHELGNERKLEIRARVSLSEEDTVAKDDLTIKTEWVTICA